MARSGRTKRTYTDDDKAKALVVLTSNGGNKSETARDLGIPLATLRTWIREWDANGTPIEVTARVKDAEDDFLEKAKKVRYELITKVESLIPEATIKQMTPMMTGIGILTDKINKIEGVDVQHHEHHHRHELPSVEVVAEQVAGFLSAALEATRKREEIIDAEVIEEQPAGLLPSASELGE